MTLQKSSSENQQKMSAREKRKAFTKRKKYKKTLRTHRTGR